MINFGGSLYVVLFLSGALFVLVLDLLWGMVKERYRYRMEDINMSMYRCSECEDMVDNDYHPCTEDTRRGPMSCDLLCPECAAVVEEHKEAREYEISQQHAQWCVDRGLT